MARDWFVLSTKSKVSVHWAWISLIFLFLTRLVGVNLLRISRRQDGDRLCWKCCYLLRMARDWSVLCNKPKVSVLWVWIYFIFLFSLLCNSYLSDVSPTMVNINFFKYIFYDYTIISVTDPCDTEGSNRYFGHCGTDSGHMLYNTNRCRVFCCVDGSNSSICFFLLS